MTSDWSVHGISRVHVLAALLTHTLRYDVYDTYDIMLK